MEPVLIFYTVISVSLVCIVLILGVVGYYAVKTLQIAQQVLYHSMSVARDVHIAADSFQVGLLQNALKIFQLFLKRR